MPRYTIEFTGDAESEPGARQLLIAWAREFCGEDIRSHCVEYVDGPTEGSDLVRHHRLGITVTREPNP